MAARESQGDSPMRYLLAVLLVVGCVGCDVTSHRFIVTDEQGHRWACDDYGTPDDAICLLITEPAR